MTDPQIEQVVDTVDARPEKRFFISMLIRDIELIPAILDLVDNSVDGATSLRGDRDFTGLAVELQVTPEVFSIRDNCGGIPLQVAKDYAFRFGRPEEVIGAAGTVGQFGVGMKRALFKLGQQFVVESNATTSRFVMSVHVPTWEEDDDPDWTFPLIVSDPAHDGSNVGTRVEVSQLHETVADDFRQDQTIAAIAHDLRLRHQDALTHALTISLNGVQMRPVQARLIQSDLVSPIHRATWYGGNGERVELELFAGLAAAKDDADDGDAQSFRSGGPAGWYVFANRRLLLAADKTTTTGWGRGPAAYHPQYRRFRGYAYLEGPPNLLPWNTTKTGVDQDSRVFRWTRAQLEVALQNVQSVINRAKKERSERPPDEQVLNRALDTAPERPLVDVEPSPTMRVPEPLEGGPPNTQRISYSVGRYEYERARDALDAGGPTEVGRETFDYFYRKQVE